MILAQASRARPTRLIATARLSLFLVISAALSLACSSSSSGGSSTAEGGAAGGGGSGGSAGGGGSGGSGGAMSGTSLSGTLGALGPALPTVSSIVISNSGETLIYMTSVPITCETVKTSKWLLTLPAGSQVVEIVDQGNPMLGTTNTEVNYAPGGKSSSYEVNAVTGSVTYTTATVHGVVEGTVMATYKDGSKLSGKFHAEFCDGGQGY